MAECRRPASRPRCRPQARAAGQELLAAASGQRLRDDKVTLAVIGVLCMHPDHGRVRALVHRARSLRRLGAARG